MITSTVIVFVPLILSVASIVKVLVDASKVRIEFTQRFGGARGRGLTSLVHATAQV